MSQSHNIEQIPLQAFLQHIFYLDRNINLYTMKVKIAQQYHYHLKVRLQI